VEIRKIRRAELSRFREIITQAFVLAPNQVKHYLGDDLDLSATRALFRDGKMKSALQLLPGKVWFNQKAIPMGRIAWVATPPEERRRGYVRHLMEHCIEEMRQREFPISILFPFSFEYYRRFGYEHAGDWKIYTLDLSALSGIPTPPGEMVPAGPEKIAIINEIYETFSKGRTCSLVRDEQYWRKWVMMGAERKRHSYLWQSRGNIRGYIIYEIVDHGEFKRTVQVRELIALDHEARCGLLNFLFNHRSQAQKVILTVPIDDLTICYLNNPRMEVRIKPSFMARIVDLKSAWESKDYWPEARGEMVFQLEDSLASWNKGTFRLSVSNGQGKLEETQDPVDLSCDILTLTQIYCGYLNFEEAVAIGRVQIHDSRALELAHEIFRESRPYMNDIF